MAHRKALTLLLVLMPLSAAAAPERIAVVVGNNEAAGRGRLRYAERDARQMSEVLQQLGGVDEVRLLLDRDAAALEASLSDLTRRASPTSTLFFFYSGHADDQALLMRDTRLGFEKLRAMLEAAPNQLFVAFIDACQAGSIARLKGGSAVPVVNVDYLGDDRLYSGGIFITSGAPGENAQESDELEASFFTHYLISGLRGAADTSGDRRISLDEAYRFAYRHTLSRTRGTLLGPQHPTRALDVEGRGQLVLTWLSERDSYLVLPERSAGTYFLRGEAEGDLIAEVTKSQTERIRIALPPGRYEVSKAENGLFLSQTVEVRGREETLLDETRMGAQPLAALQVKGGPSPSRSAFSLGYRLSSGFLQDAGLNHGVDAAYLLGWGPLQLGPVLSYVGGRYRRDDAIEVSNSSIEAGLRIRATWYAFWRIGFFAGLEVLAAWTVQRGSVGDRSDTITAATFPERAVLGIDIELTAPFALVVYGHAGVVAFEAESGFTARFIGGAGAALELRL